MVINGLTDVTIADFFTVFKVWAVGLVYAVVIAEEVYGDFFFLVFIFDSLLSQPYTFEVQNFGTLHAHFSVSF